MDESKKRTAMLRAKREILEKAFSSDCFHKNDEDLNMIGVSSIDSLFSKIKIDEKGTGEESTLARRRPNYLEGDDLNENFDKSGFGEVMTLVNVNPTILEECQLCMHVDRVENILYDSYIVEFAYDPTCNYYERGKYGCRNFHVTKLPLVMLRLLLFLSASLHMLVFACLDNLFAYKMPMHRKYVRLRCVCHVFHDALFVLQFLSFM